MGVCVKIRYDISEKKVLKESTIQQIRTQFDCNRLLSLRADTAVETEYIKSEVVATLVSLLPSMEINIAWKVQEQLLRPRLATRICT